MLKQEFLFGNYTEATVYSWQSYWTKSSFFGNHVEARFPSWELYWTKSPFLGTILNEEFLLWEPHWSKSSFLGTILNQEFILGDHIQRRVPSLGTMMNQDFLLGIYRDSSAFLQIHLGPNLHLQKLQKLHASFIALKRVTRVNLGQTELTVVSKNADDPAYRNWSLVTLNT
jgi:hypothetical protein